ncbi:MAG: hypothetical protein WBN66_12375 [Smithella sp.]
METITGYLSAHPTALVIGVSIIILFVLIFTVKSALKLLLGLLILAVVAYGYFYLKDPAHMPKPQESVEIMKSGIDQIKDKSKSFVKDSKDLYKKTKTAPKDVGRMLESSRKEVDREFQKK